MFTCAVCCVLPQPYCGYLSLNRYVNATLVPNPAGGDHTRPKLPSSVNPYPYPGGIYSPEALNLTGAEFGVGVSMSTGVNQYTGLLGGLAVFSEALDTLQMAEVCGWPDHPPHDSTI
jgi:hypothetical protein